MYNQYVTHRSEKITRRVEPLTPEESAELEQRTHDKQVTAVVRRAKKELYEREEKRAKLAEITAHLRTIPETPRSGAIETFLAGQFDGTAEQMGGASRVYHIDRGDRPGLVAKVERLFDDPDADQPFSPWVNTGLPTQPRESLDITQNLKQREQIHLAVKNRLEQVGLRTAEYVGAVIVPGFDDETLLTIDALGPEQAREEMGAEFHEIPMYAEVWQNPGGELVGDDEEALFELYSTEEGQQELLHVADGLIELGRQGFSFDVSRADHMFGISEAVSISPNRHLPYPENFLHTHEDTLVAIDFNVGFDLVAEGIWDPALVAEHNHGVLMESTVDGRMYANYQLEQEVQDRLRQRREDDLAAIADQVNETNHDEIVTQYRDRLYYWARIDKEVDRLFTQIKVGVAIKRTIEDIRDPELAEKSALLREEYHAAPRQDIIEEENLF